MPAESADWSAIRSAFPSEGLFAEKDFLLSPDPFPIDDKFAKELEQLGHRLYVFQRACNELYHRSVKGKSLDYFTTHRELVRMQQERKAKDKAAAEEAAVKKMVKADSEWSGDDFVKQSDALARG
jgi:hypothetical protein